ncbi:hypothetical protein PFFCH_00863 [Plasmodium falciparum FCH/4]|uniref:Proteasome alpha-type subunits domain-containing protein n=1 Tax=Plasmodium falciparum FCH/4 TaxID=1036724 RepID=A0A024VTY3_PLAFA|nr:hypothetical protein PFFCH_00863 [Plasmodium falciparum FCH/4]
MNPIIHLMIRKKNKNEIDKKEDDHYDQEYNNNNDNNNDDNSLTNIKIFKEVENDIVCVYYPNSSYNQCLCLSSYEYITNGQEHILPNNHDIYGHNNKNDTYMNNASFCVNTLNEENIKIKKRYVKDISIYNFCCDDKYKGCNLYLHIAKTKKLKNCKMNYNIPYEHFLENYDIIKIIFKIQQISEHIGIVYAGMPGDFRVLLKRARKEAIRYSLQYGSEILVKELVKIIASIVQEFTQTGGVRPFGLSLLICGVDVYGYHLYQIDPSGCYFNWMATCVGKDYQNNMSFLEKRYNKDIEIEDAIHTAILTLKESYEGVLNEKNIEIGVAYDNKPFKILTQNEIKDYLIEIE